MPRLAARIVLAVALIFGSILASPATVAFAPQVNGGSSLIYRTDFENVTLLYPEPHNDNGLNMGIPNSLVYQNYDQSRPGGATAWMEGLDRKTSGFTCHSGTRCLGLELFNITKSRRDAFSITNLDNLTGNEVYVSEWLYLPSNWQTYTPSGSSWYELADLYFPNSGVSTGPYGAIYVIQTPPSPNFELEVVNVKVGGTEQYLYNNLNFPLPRGRWFNLEYYVLRSTTNGRVVVWLDGQLLVDASGFDNEGTSSDWSTQLAKIYYNMNSNNSSPYYLWVDDLEMYNGIPTSTTTTSTSPSSSTTAVTLSSTTNSTVSSTTSSVSSSTSNVSAQMFTAVDSGQGSVTPNCPNGCSETVGSQVTVTANPASGWLFNGWSTQSGQSCSSNACTFNMSNNQVTLKATFTQITQTLTTNVASESGSVSPNCLSGCQQQVGSSVSVSATATSGWTFSSWTVTGASCSGGSSSNPCTFTMPNNSVTVSATFTQITVSSTTTSAVPQTAVSQTVTVTQSAVTQSVTVTQSGVTQSVTVTQSAVTQTATVTQSRVIQAVTVTQTVTVTQGASATQKTVRTTNQPKPPPAPPRGRNQ